MIAHSFTAECIIESAMKKCSHTKIDVLRQICKYSSLFVYSFNIRSFQKEAEGASVDMVGDDSQDIRKQKGLKKW